jgi:hypothetical protein
VPVPSGPGERRGGGFRVGACKDRVESIFSKRPTALSHSGTKQASRTPSGGRLLLGDTTNGGGADVRGGRRREAGVGTPGHPVVEARHPSVGSDALIAVSGADNRAMEDRVCLRKYDPAGSPGRCFVADPLASARSSVRNECDPAVNWQARAWADAWSEIRGAQR